MDTTPLRVAVIVGSTREGRFGPTVAAWIAGLISRRSDLKADLIDPVAPALTHRVRADKAESVRADEAESVPADAADRVPADAADRVRADEADSVPADAADRVRADEAGSGNAGAAPAGPATVTEALGLADAFVVVTPEYNHSYPAPLKAIIDGHFSEWRAKPVAFVSYGGLSGGLRAVEHLRPVFAELHAVTVRDTVSFHGARQCFGGDGLPVDPGSTVAAGRMLDGLAWWGHTLRDARVLRPYPMGA
ncbi:NADPH-dependent FMN reductase [Nucisporomicrobium flavum]|uniref:NADPH-dependent FMN reductase n=1 Tax=Nucisporomicrobium flavum TaxID=2785915 RepID=UPI0018F280C6|nr:NAD(P)H-dependent oxidoreductase [Nucisporomicrobium flavum]